MKILLADLPYPTDDPSRHHGGAWDEQGKWPARWIQVPGLEAPFVAAFRLEVASDGEVVRLHTSADERYELFLNGQRIARGPERGDRDHWFFESVEVTLVPGKNTLVAVVSALGARRAFAQMSVEPGFLLSPDDPAVRDRFATGYAPWEGRRLTGYEFKSPQAAWGTGDNLIVHAEAMEVGVEAGACDGWGSVEAGELAVDRRANDADVLHRLTPAMLPAMVDEPWKRGRVRWAGQVSPGPTSKVPFLAAESSETWTEVFQRLLEGGSATVPPHVTLRVLIDLEDYVCGYPHLVLSHGAGASVRVHWQESLFNEPDAKTKGDRNAIEGKFFTTIWSLEDGVGDTFLASGRSSQPLRTLWWQAGRYVELLIETGEDELIVDRFWIEETRYPLNATPPKTSDDRFRALTPIMVRALQMCSHETYMDCPFYEQLMYAGDTRLEILTTYALTNDDRLPRKAIRMFDASRIPDGLSQSRYPSRVRQMIPTFCLWWIGMIHDFTLWRGDLAFVRERMQGARQTMEAFLAFRNADGLIEGPQGWNFVDWVPEWPGGMPPGAARGVNGSVNLQTVLALRYLAEVDGWLGESEFEARWERLSTQLFKTVCETFWSEERGLFSEDPEHTSFSEHAQCLAVLTDLVPGEKLDRLKVGLDAGEGLAETTIYFSHYLFEAGRRLGLTDRLRRRLETWYVHLDHGLKTTVEMPEPTRSDCHAWGAHPLFHAVATFAGIRPVAPGFERVLVDPLYGVLNDLDVALETPRGTLRVRLEGESVSVDAPAGIEVLRAHPPLS